VRTILTAAAFSSALYRRVVGRSCEMSFGMTPSSFPRSGASKKPRAIHPPTPGRGPKSDRGNLSFYTVLAELQTAVIRLLSHCPYCQRAGPT
jgi:hypothetical protein